MKLYSANLSPFAARPRIAIYAKGLAVEILPPPDGPGSDAYKAINPTGKVPCLVTSGGECIPESDAIVEFFEDAFPDQSPLRPVSAEDKAKARVLARVADLYVMGPMSKLFGQLNPATRDQAVTDAQLAELEKGLDGLNVFLSGQAFAALRFERGETPDFSVCDVIIDFTTPEASVELAERCAARGGPALVIGSTRPISTLTPSE